MSHITKMKLQVYSIPALQFAAQELGLGWREDTTYKWFGSPYQDMQKTAEVDEKDLGTCDYVIYVPGNARAYEVGVKRMGDGHYELLYDPYNNGYGLMPIIGPDGETLKDAYNIWAFKEQNPEAVAFQESVNESGHRVCDAIYN